ncbi:unnamed protein product [Rhizopus stolonifer]
MMKKAKKKQPSYTENKKYQLPSPPNDKKITIENFQSSSAPVGRPDDDLLNDFARFMALNTPPTPQICQMDIELFEYLDQDELAPDAVLFPEL